MRRALSLTLVLVTACAGMDETVRKERGPLLRTFERPRVVEGGVAGRVSVAWPLLTVQLQGFDTCRTETIDEYAEDEIHEHRGSGAGAALSAGVLFTVASGVLLGVGQLLSGTPNFNTIDGAGNYGAPPRFTARAWSLGLIIVGLPALTVGIVQSLRTGEDVETVRVEQLASQRDETCNVRAIDGPLWLRSESGVAAGPLPTKDGALTLDASTLKGDIDELVFYERVVTLDEGSLSLLTAFNGCGHLLREGAAEPEAMSSGALLKRVEWARECRQVRGDLVAAEQTRLEAEVQRRRLGGEAGAFAPGAKSLGSFEEATTAWPPRFTLEEGGPDADRSVESMTGQTVLLKGRVQAGLSPNIGVVTVGTRELFVFIPPDAKWASDDFSSGSPVEVIGVVSGLQTVGDRTAPLVRAVWMRKVSAGSGVK